MLKAREATNVYAADYQNGNAFEYADPTGGAAVSTIAAGDEAFGTAVMPTKDKRQPVISSI
jgi:hypothetical protein